MRVPPPPAPEGDWPGADDILRAFVSAGRTVPMEQVARIPVPTGVHALGGETNACVVGDDGATLVDPGAESDDLSAAVAARDVSHLAVTHTHPDHVGGVAAYADRVTVHVHAAHVDRFRAATGVEPDRTVADGDRIGPLEVVETPGHAPDHLAFSLAGADGEAILCGDLAVATGSVAVGAPDGDVRAYLASLERIRERDPARLYPGHGPEIDDPAATVKRLREHRLDRERRVLAAVEDGATTPDEVVDAAYDKDLSGVRELARATVVAHLRKLDAEGRIDFDGDRARPV